MQNLKPLNNQVIVSWKDPSAKERFTKSGIILPENTGGKERCVELGEVVAYADGLTDANGKDIDLKAGDKVMFTTFTPFDLEINKVLMWAVNAKDLILILNETNPEK